jgi:undecaprenyl-diphosphatase
VKVSHTILITITATIGFFFLWLERIYHNSPLFGDITTGSESIVTNIALLISAATSPALVVIIGLLAAIFAIEKHHEKLWWFFTGVTLTGIAVSELLKLMIQLPRPEYALLQLGSYGFPSSHATVATIICIAGIWISYHWKDVIRKKNWAYIFILFWILVCTSRIVLGVHSGSDVLAGIMIGAIIASIAILIAPRILDKKTT